MELFSYGSFEFQAVMTEKEHKEVSKATSNEPKLFTQ